MKGFMCVCERMGFMYVCMCVGWYKEGFHVCV